MRDLYNKLYNLLSTIDYSAIWTGFHQYPFALYDENKVYLHDHEIPWDERFLGNTSIEYNGANIAIWNMAMDPVQDEEILASELVHEMFHAFQQEHYEKRYPKDLVTLSYPLDTLNFQFKNYENKILIAALRTKNMLDKKDLLSEFVSIRKKREEQIGELIQCEYLTETIEGISEFVGTMALKQLNEEKFKDRIAEYERILLAPNTLLFDIRRISYYVGTIFLIVLQDANIPFYHELEAAEVSLFDHVSRQIPLKNFEIQSEHWIETELQIYAENKLNQFEQFFSKPYKKITNTSTISGYDPMNMIKMDNRILCSHFILLMNFDTEEREFVKGPVVVQLENNSMNEVTAYYIHE